MEGQPGLADPAGAGQGHEADVLPAQQLAHGRDLPLPADERREWRRQIRLTGKTSRHGRADHTSDPVAVMIVGRPQAVNDEVGPTHQRAGIWSQV